MRLDAEVDEGDGKQLERASKLKSIRTRGLILQFLGFVLIIIGLFLPWYFSDPYEISFSGYKLDDIGLPLILFSSLLLIGILIRRPYVSSFFGAVLLSLASAAFIFQKNVFVNTFYRDTCYGKICLPIGPPEEFVIGPGLYLTLVGALVILMAGIAVWLLERKRLYKHDRNQPLTG